MGSVLSWLQVTSSCFWAKTWQLATEIFDRRARDPKVARVRRNKPAGWSRGDRQDHPRALSAHLPPRRRHGQELRLHDIGNPPGELFQFHLNQRSALHIADPDHIKRTIDASRLLYHLVHMLLNRLPMERIHLRHLGPSTALRNLLRHRLKRQERAPKEKHPRPLTSKGPSHGSATSPPAP